MNSSVTPDGLYAPLAPYTCGQLNVGQGHQLYWEQCGSAGGIPMVYLHGGPGSGCSPRHRQFFDPRLCRAVLFDQRGCGRSLPRGALEHNSSDALVSDIEALRLHLGIARWLVVGGSWGAALAVAYAAAHPTACLGLVIRGVFLTRTSDVDWFFKGAAQLLPDAWEQLFHQAPGNAPDAVLQWLHAGLHGTSAEVALVRVSAWEAWEQSLSLQQVIAPRVLAVGDAQADLLLDKYRLQSHYLINHCFWEEPGLLSQAQGLSGMPTAILHGRQDWICRAQAAWDLHHSVAGSRLLWIDGCGHNPFEPAMASALVAAIKHFTTHGDFINWGGDFSHAQIAQAACRTDDQ